MAADPSTLYARLSPIRFTDFTPSRVTRISSNTYLQEHGPLEDLLHSGRVCELELERERSHSAMVVCNERPLKGRYVDIDFAISYPGGNRSRVDQLQKFCSEQYAGRSHSRSDPTANGTVHPLYMRTRSESRRTAIRRKPTPESEVHGLDVLSMNGAGMVDTPSFVIIDGKAEQPMAKGNGVKPKRAPETKPNASPLAANKIRVKKRRTAVSPPHSPPPPPPPLVVESISPSVDLTSLKAELSPPVAPASPENKDYIALQFHVGSTNLQATDSPIPVGGAVQDSWGEERDTCGSESPKDLNQSMDGSPIIGGYKDFVRYSDSEGSSDAEDVQGFPISVCRSHAHKPLGRWTPSDSPIGPPTWSSPNGQTGGSISPLVLSPMLQDSSSPPHSPQIGKTKPVPPPKRSSISHSPDTFRVPPANRALKTMQSSPEIFPDSIRSRSVSFLQCKVGQDYGQYSADYLGSMEIDCYLDCVDVVAKQLVESRTVDIIAYVTSEKIRLAPPNNSALLFKSFAIKDLLSVQKCSKNKRIIGLVLWKPKGNPICHVLRCPNYLVSSALHEAVWLQSQSVDSIALNKVNSPQSLDLLSQPPSDVSSSSGTSNENDSSSSPRDMPFSPRDTPFSPRDTPFSPTELLHKFPAIYIGSAAAGKLHSINDVIQKVLSQNRPSQAMEVGVWLSLTQVRFIDMSNDSELICATHDTSRIRAIGVYSQDKRFIGYIIKEEGKPLMGHVLRCNSAALMVSLVSFLRQSCQITFYQRGGSFYDELSTDDSEECEHSEGSTSRCESHGILKRLRSLTASTRSSTSTMASFVSHAPLLKQQSPARDLPQRRRDLVHNSNVFSPLDFSEDDYARFSVNYVGSAALDLPLTPSSILEAMKAFSEEGVAAGQAAVPKNVIHMQVSSLGITLTDKKHRLFVNRNYPRKQLEGCCIHPNNSKYFAIASQRPGFPSSMKVHVFRQVQESTEQIMDAIKFWLEIDPVPS